MTDASTPTRRAVGAALLAAVRTDRDDTLARHVERHGCRALTRAARQHGVEGFLDLALQRIGAGTAESRAGRLAAAAQHLRACGLLAEVARALSAADIGWATVKGPVLAGHYYERTDLRRYVDLDLLVHPHEFTAALLALERIGGLVDAADWPVAASAEPAEVLIEYDGVPVDLHWNLVSAAADRRRVALPSASLLERRRQVDLGCACVPTLDPVDTLVHVALHAALSGGARLVWLLDIDRVVAAGVAWPELVRRAESAGVGPQVGLMLRRARSRLGTPVPDEVLARLGPRGSWLLGLLAVHQGTPVGIARTDTSALRLVTRATASSSARSWARLAAHALRRLDVRHPPGPAGAAVGGSADPRCARERYLALVAGQS